MLGVPEIQTLAPAASALAAHAETGPISLFEVEKRHILSVMDKTASRTAAAKVLGISIRTLRNKLRDYGVTNKDDDEGADAAKPGPAGEAG
jgi:transcriptional regulator with PAS, ATPase and Fis domain